MTQAQYKVVSPLGTEEVETLELAWVLLAQKKTEFAESTKYAFSVNGYTIDAAGNKVIYPCDLNESEPPANFFEAFDYRTGEYTLFDNFSAAKAYVLGLQAAYLVAVDSSFTIQQQVQGAEGIDPTWVTINAPNTIA
jgi:hypothetical protein